jgi:hypothetical protein
VNNELFNWSMQNVPGFDFPLSSYIVHRSWTI